MLARSPEGVQNIWGLLKQVFTGPITDALLLKTNSIKALTAGGIKQHHG